MKEFLVKGRMFATFSEVVEAESVTEASEKVLMMPGVELAWESEETEITDVVELPSESRIKKGP